MQKIITILICFLGSYFQIAQPQLAHATPMNYIWETTSDYDPNYWSLDSLRFIYDPDHPVDPAGGMWETMLETYINGSTTPEYFRYEECWSYMDQDLVHHGPGQYIQGIPYVTINFEGVNYYLEFLDHAMSDTTRGFIFNGPGNSVIGYELVDVYPVPEPSTIILLGTGLIGLVRLRKKDTR